MREVLSSAETPALEYFGLDIVAPLIANLRSAYATDKWGPDGATTVNFFKFDIAEQTLWPVDVVIVRDVLFHFSPERALEVLRRIDRSGSKWLLTTTHPRTVNAEARRLPSRTRVWELLAHQPRGPALLPAAAAARHRPRWRVSVWRRQARDAHRRAVAAARCGRVGSITRNLLSGHAVPRRVVLVARRPRGLHGGGGVGGGGARGVGGDRELGARRRTQRAPAPETPLRQKPIMPRSSSRPKVQSPLSSAARISVHAWWRRLPQSRRARASSYAWISSCVACSAPRSATARPTAGRARRRGRARSRRRCPRPRDTVCTARSRASRRLEPLERLQDACAPSRTRERAVQRLLAARRLGRVAQRLVGEDLLEVVVGGEGGGGGFAVGRDVGHCMRRRRRRRHWNAPRVACSA